MIRRTTQLAWTLVLVAVSPAAALAEIDLSKPMLCAMTEAVECIYEKPCSHGPVSDLNIPPFLRIDAKAMTLQEHNGTRTTRFRTASVENGHLVLQGHEERAFSISISQETGRLSASATDSDAGYVLFGICTNQ